MKTYICQCVTTLVILLAIVNDSRAQTGNHVFSGAEAVNYGSVDLSTPGGQTWSTYRGASPGYFSAVGNATYTGAADANANVNGYVKYYVNNAGATTFSFPVGTGSDLRTLSISGTIPATGVFATAWIVGDPTTTTDPTSPNAGVHPVTSLATPIVEVSPVGMWDWQDVSGNASGMTITVSIPDVSTFSKAGNLRLVGWIGTRWVNLGTSGGSGNAENSTLSGTMIAGITAIGIGTIDKALPVTLISFNAVREGTTNLLSWSTSMETNSRNFEIERAADGKNWQKIGERQAQQESSVQADYSFIDHKPLTGLNYYRLRMVDLDDTFAYSRIRVADAKEAGQISLYPNPVSATLYVKGIDTSEISETVIMDANGKVLMRSNTISPDGMAVNKFSQGMYFLKITTKSGVASTHKLFIKN